MKQLKKSRELTGLFVTLTFGLIISIFGSGIGTYCWYEYKANANVQYGGTAFGESDSITIGLISPNQLDGFAEAHTLVEDSTSIPNKWIYWSMSSSNLNSDTIKDYESRLGYATNEISATSSGSFKDQDEFKLKTSPRYLASKEYEYALKSEYSFFSLALKSGNGLNNYYLKQSEIKCGNNVKDAVRIHFGNPNDSDNSFIYNPSKANSGETAVGGLLNLKSKQSDLFDFASGTEVEHIYGEYTDLSYSGEKYTGEKEVDPKDVTCFKSNHQKGLYIPTFIPKTASYFGSNSCGHKAITYTNQTTRIAEVDISIYLEGWDHACIDSGLSYSYDLNLTFSFGNRG